jgi:hypothetical protein
LGLPKPVELWSPVTVLEAFPDNCFRRFTTRERRQRIEGRAAPQKAKFWCKTLSSIGAIFYRTSTDSRNSRSGAANSRLGRLRELPRKYLKRPAVFAANGPSMGKHRQNSRFNGKKRELPDGTTLRITSRIAEPPAQELATIRT